MKTIFQHWFAPLKRVLPRQLWQPLRSMAICFLTPIRFSVSTGHGKSSFLMRAVNKNGDPIPWYTYPAIDFLFPRDYQDKHILEFGSGQSTLWWASRAKSVMSFEEDPQWFATIRAQVPSNVDLHNIPSVIDEIESLLNSRRTKFDIIVVDGYFRREVAALSLRYLAPGGALILDNSEGYGFYDEFKVRNCRRIDFFGFAPGVILRHCTSIVFVNDCFLLKPDVPILNFV
jgi:hypothetical protein